MPARPGTAGASADSATAGAVRALNFSLRSRLPLILQNEVSECALACICMIAAYHGYRTTLTELRRRFSIPLTGMTAHAILAIADDLQLSARSLRIELRELRQLRTPAILHWRLDHFVVLRQIKRRGVVVHDPARGKRFVPWHDVSRFFTGVAIELHPAKGFVKKAATDKVRIRDLWDRSQGLGVTLIQLVLLSAVLQLIVLLSPLINQLVVDEAIARNDRNFLQAILIGFSLLLVSRVIVEYLRATTSMVLGQMLAFQLRSNTLRHVLGLPAGFFEKRHIGDLISRFGSLLPIQKLITSALVTVLIDGALSITTFIVMFVYSPMLAMMVVGATLLALISRLATFPYVRRLTEEKILADAEVQSIFLESIRAIRAVKLFGREVERHTHWQNAFVEATNIGIQLDKFGIAAGTASRLLAGMLDLAVLSVGALQVIDGPFTLGMFFAFQVYRAQFSSGMSALTAEYFAFRTVGIHLERLTDIVYTEPEVRLASTGFSPRRLTGNIVLRDARFRYGDNQPWILDRANLQIHAGDRVALVGASGGGKSTVLKILLGLHPLAEGDVLFDGVPLGTVGLRTVRSQVATVMQDDLLLSGTLAENIAFFDNAADVGQIAAAARAAQIENEILRMPMGFDTRVGDMGAALSGGQKQRLLLARALYRNPRILFLDEGTANLDETTEERVLRSLLATNTTQLIVAHRTAAIRACNRVLCLADGKIAALNPCGDAGDR